MMLRVSPGSGAPAARINPLEPVPVSGCGVCAALAETNNNPRCIEVATNVPGKVVVRSSASGRAVEFTPAEWADFLSGAKLGEIDLSAQGAGARGPFRRVRATPAPSARWLLAYLRLLAASRDLNR